MSPSAPKGLGHSASVLNATGYFERLATIVADRCHGTRKRGQAAERYAIIWQAARLGALEVEVQLRPLLRALRDSQGLPHSSRVEVGFDELMNVLLYDAASVDPKVAVQEVLE